VKRPAKVHWLRENAQERTPHRVLTFDTETDLAATDQPERQVLRLWAARLDRRHGIDPRKPRQERYSGTTAADLAATVDGIARADASLWVFAHNLGFDLAVTELPVQLNDLGWRVTEGALTTDDPWCRMAKGSRRLVMADTWSFFPTSVEYLGELLNQRKPKLPPWEGSFADWMARCQADVAITADAIIGAMDWWDARRLGNWSITGPATGWSSYRHRRPAPHVLVDPDPEARALEMRAVMGGRREARRIGVMPRGLYVDLDMHTAHLTAMAGLPLPYRRLRRFDSLPLDSRALRSTLTDVLAECTVRTSSPRYPWDSGRGMFYPVGTFRTVLPGPELREARQRGELVSIGRGYEYLVSPHMSDWALWLAELLNEGTPDVPPQVRLMAKHWSRCVPGKWAGHTSEVLDRSPDPRPGWAVERAMLMPQRRQADLLRIGNERWTIVRDEWADDAFPAILAWIQGATRVALGRLVDMMGADVVTMNTDGLVIDASPMHAAYLNLGDDDETAMGRTVRELSALCAGWDDAIAPFSVRVKAAASTLTVVSPQHVIIGEERRLSGVPKKSVKLADGRYTFTQWPGLRVQLRPDRLPGYITRQATVDLSHVPPTGWLDVDGTVSPVAVNLHTDGTVGVELLTARSLDWRQLAPIDRQHPLLRPIMRAAMPRAPRMTRDGQLEAEWAQARP